MCGQVAYATVRELLESRGWTLMRLYRCWRVFEKAGREPIVFPVVNREVAAVHAQRIKRILEAEAKERASSP